MAPWSRFPEQGAIGKRNACFFCLRTDATHHDTLVKVSGTPTEDRTKSLLAASDVLGTGWFAADAAAVGPRKTVAVVGDGAVGRMGILAAKQMGAERMIGRWRHADRLPLAKLFCALYNVEQL